MYILHQLVYILQLFVYILQLFVYILHLIVYLSQLFEYILQVSVSLLQLCTYCCYLFTYCCCLINIAAVCVHITSVCVHLAAVCVHMIVVCIHFAAVLKILQLFVYILQLFEYIATLVTHHFLRAHIFFTKMLESNILYDNLLIDILSVWWHRKNIGITHVNHSATPQSECLFFLFAFCARHYPRWSLWPKNVKKNFFSSKPPFSVVEISNTVTVWGNARFDVILTSVTIIKQIFFRKLSCYKSLVDIEVSKH